MNEGTDKTWTVTDDGVTVLKTLERGADGTVTVTLEVETDRRSPATVSVVERVLESIPDSALELHADAAEHWQLDPNPVFEREFTPGESYTTFYRVGEVDAHRFASLEDEPALQVVATERADVADVVDRNASNAVRDVIGGERDSVLEASPDEEAADEPGGFARASSGGVVRVLANELEQGYVDEETKAQLRDALELGPRQDVRIRHLQGEVSDLAAYVEMFDEFVDRFGTLEEVFEEMDEELSSVRSEVSSLREEHESLAEDHAAVAAAVSERDDDRPLLDDRVGSLEEDLDELEEWMDEFGQFKSRLCGVVTEFGGADLEE